jgi:hypothetical protein
MSETVDNGVSLSSAQRTIQGSYRANMSGTRRSYQAPSFRSDDRHAGSDRVLVSESFQTEIKYNVFQALTMRTPSLLPTVVPCLHKRRRHVQDMNCSMESTMISLLSGRLTDRMCLNA